MKLKQVMLKKLGFEEDIVVDEAGVRAKSNRVDKVQGEVLRMMTMTPHSSKAVGDDSSSREQVVDRIRRPSSSQSKNTRPVRAAAVWKMLVITLKVCGTMKCEHHVGIIMATLSKMRDIVSSRSSSSSSNIQSLSVKKIIIMKYVHTQAPKTSAPSRF